MATGKKPEKIIRNGIGYVLVAILFLSSVSEFSVQAAQKENAGTKEGQNYTEEWYDIDGGDAEYWKYYNKEGDWILEQENPAGQNHGDGTSAASEDGDTLESPYTGKSYTVLPGYEVTHAVDVSKYQEEIDWNAVKEDGVDSVIIRCAYRGYGDNGSMATDPVFEEHMKGALEAGLHAGVYIYSQAITEEEGREEAQKCLDVCADYIDQLDLPIVMDVEYASPNGSLGGRLYNAKLSKSQQTEICKAFSDVIDKAGYQPMIYANKSMLTDEMQAAELTDDGEQIWLAHYTTNTNYSSSPYVLWQYSSSGTVSGITGAADVDFIFTKNLLSRVPKWKAFTEETGSGVRMSWENITGADGYEIEKSTDGTSWSQLVSLKAGAAVSYTDTAVKKGERCYYRFRAYLEEENEKKYSDYSESGSIECNDELATPVLVSAKAADYKSIQITWNPVEGAEGYRVYRKVSGGSWKSIIKNTSDTSYTDTKAETGTTYSYTVRAIKKVNGEEQLSDYDHKGVSAKAIPATPSLKSASCTGYKNIKVTWGKVEEADGYRVYRKVADGSWKMIKDNVAALSVTDNDAVTGTTYYYTVRAYCTVKEKKVFGNYVKKGISAKALTAAPKLKSLTSVSYKSLKITWEGVSGASGYRVYREEGDGKFKYLGDVDASGRSYTDQYRITCGKKYSYTVRSYRTVDGKRVYGNYDHTGLSGKAIPSTPSVSLSSTAKAKVKVSWKKVSGASGYIVYRKNLSTGKWERIKTISSGSTVSYTASGTSGKKVFYTVRAYRTVDGTNVYSNYKKDVSIKVK